MSQGQADTLTDASAPEGGDKFLFPQLDLCGPIQELESTAERKSRIYQSLGEEENARRLDRALQIARTRLCAVLSSPRAPAGS